MTARADDAARSRFYVGAGIDATHHTGYTPDRLGHAEQWVPGGKVFGGYRILDSLLLESAYHYLGNAHFNEQPGVLAHENAHAFSATLVYYSPTVSSWLVDTHVLVRGGLAYKQINQRSILATRDEGILSFVVGLGLQFEFTRHMFGRVEYEFISTAVGGPNQPAPMFRGAFNVNMGGTHRAINLMNTPISVSVGWWFDP